MSNLSNQDIFNIANVYQNSKILKSQKELVDVTNKLGSQSIQLEKTQKEISTQLELQSKYQKEIAKLQRFSNEIALNILDQGERQIRLLETSNEISIEQLNFQKNKEQIRALEKQEAENKRVQLAIAKEYIFCVKEELDSFESSRDKFEARDLLESMKKILDKYTSDLFERIEDKEYRRAAYELLLDKLKQVEVEFTTTERDAISDLSDFQQLNPIEKLSSYKNIERLISSITKMENANKRVSNTISLLEKELDSAKTFADLKVLIKKLRSD